MAVPKTARLVAAEAISATTRLLSFEMEGGAPLGFVGGQYIIVDTGLPLPGGKIAKRAYSILSSDAAQTSFEIAVRRIASGPGSGYMHELALGATLRFSGPWGKFVPGDEGPGPTLVVATDTGITAALGLVQAVSFARRLSETTLVWLQESSEYFLPASLVSRRVPRACAQLQVEWLPPVGHRERLAAARAHGEREREWRARRGSLTRAYLAGDGAVIYPLADALVAAGLRESGLVLECFFNNPARKAPSAAADGGAANGGGWGNGAGGDRA